MKSKPYVFQSSLAKYFNAFLDERITLGKSIINIKGTLKQFDMFLVQTKRSDTFISKEIYDQWLSTLANCSSPTKCIKARAIREFSTYMNTIGIDCFKPIPPRRHTEFIPHIFTQDELRRIFQASDMLRCKFYYSKTSLMVIPAILRLLFSTGIRIGEALSIKNEDVKFDKRAIVLNKTKNKNQRLAPINDSLEAVLKQYLHYRNIMPIKDIEAPSNYLFVNYYGKKCDGAVVRDWFHKILRMTNIPYKGREAGPRIHDFRHSAAVHALRQFSEAGKDTYCCLPILSVFMGHTNIQNTEYYLRLTQEMFPAILEQDTALTASIQNVISRSFFIKDHSDENI